MRVWACVSALCVVCAVLCSGETAVSGSDVHTDSAPADESFERDGDAFDAARSAAEPDVVATALLDEVVDSVSPRALKKLTAAGAFRSLFFSFLFFSFLFFSFLFLSLFVSLFATWRPSTCLPPVSSCRVVTPPIVPPPPASLLLLSPAFYLCPGDKLVLLTLYIPGLPKWHLHFKPVLAAIGHHYYNDSRVAVVVADCDMYPVSGTVWRDDRCSCVPAPLTPFFCLFFVLVQSFIRQFGVRSFPSLFFYPPNVDNAVPFPLRYLSNATALTYVEEVERNLHVTASSVAGIEDVHADVVSFMQAQATLDFEIMWKTGGERRRRLEAFEQRFRRTVMGEETADGAQGGAAVNGSATLDAAADSAEQQDGDGATSADNSAAAHAKAKRKAADDARTKEREDMDPQLLPLKELEKRAETVMTGPAPEVNEDKEAQLLEPIYKELQFQLNLVKLQEAKLMFYRSVLQDLQKHGSGSIARQLNKVTKELYRKSDLLPQSARDVLLMKISVLRMFTDALF